MEIKLNVYNGREVAKTYVADTYDLLFGTLDDLIADVDISALVSTEAGDDALAAAAAQLVANSLGAIKPLLKDVFPGLTDEELRHARVSEIAHVVMALVKQVAGEIMSLGGDGKNK